MQLHSLSLRVPQNSNGKGAEVLDFSGNLVASFLDWQVAERFVELANERSKVAELEDKISDLEKELSEVESELTEQEFQISQLEEKVQELQDEISRLKI